MLVYGQPWLRYRSASKDSSGLTGKVLAIDLSVSLFHQMTRARGALAHDDRLDALAMACGYQGSSGRLAGGPDGEDHLRV